MLLIFFRYSRCSRNSRCSRIFYFLCFLYLIYAYLGERVVLAFELNEPLPKLLHFGRCGLQELLRSLAVDAVEDHTDGDEMGVEGRLESAVFFVLDVYLAQQLCLNQTREQLINQAERNMVVRSQLVGSKRRFILLETLDDYCEQV